MNQFSKITAINMGPVRKKLTQMLTQLRYN